MEPFGKTEIGKEEELTAFPYSSTRNYSYNMSNSSNGHFFSYSVLENYPLRYDACGDPRNTPYTQEKGVCPRRGPEILKTEL
ncbi:MAG: hypothetical protein PHW56_04860 [Methanosarcinaceae archaeon]|nr:hypothetical protein [Methanosarcinaceae archaeon]